MRPPSAFGITVGSPPSSTAMQLFVVPRSIPIVFAILFVSFALIVLRSENLSVTLSDLTKDPDQYSARDHEGGPGEEARADELMPTEQER